VGSDATPDFTKDTLVSTSALVEHPFVVPDRGVQAAYTYQRDCQQMRPVEASEVFRSALKGAAMWAGMGAVLGAGLAAFGHVYAALGTLGETTAAPTLSALLPMAEVMLGGAAVGGIYGACSEASARKHEHRDYPKFGETVYGQLTREDSKLYFQPAGEEAKVDLNAFAKAPVTGGGAMGADQGQWWQQATPNVCYDDLQAEIGRWKAEPQGS
jgi:hypothetical protein